MTATVLVAVLAAGLVATALGVIAAHSMVRAAMAMIAHLTLAAALYVLLSATFVAAVQLVVYAGAVMVLFVFVIMTLGDREADPIRLSGRARVAGLLAIASLGAVLVAVSARGVPAAGQAGGGTEPSGAGLGAPGPLADVLFRHHVLELEVISVLLLVAMVGAVVLARRASIRETGAGGTEGEGT